MKIGFLATAALLIGTISSPAATFRGSAGGTDLYTCAHSPFTRASTGAVATPANCCDGKLQCPQFLSTTTLVRPKHDPHT